MKNKENNRMASPIISLVLGIISVLSVLFWYISMPSGIISIILGVYAYKKNGSKLALSGFITGIVGLSLSLFIYITMAIIIILSNMA